MFCQIKSNKKGIQNILSPVKIGFLKYITGHERSKTYINQCRSKKLRNTYPTHQQLLHVLKKFP